MTRKSLLLSLQSWTCPSPAPAGVQGSLFTPVGSRTTPHHTARDDSLLGHSNLSPSSKDLPSSPEFTKSTHGVGWFFVFFLKFSSAEQSWLNDFNPLSASPRKKKKRKQHVSAAQAEPVAPFPFLTSLHRQVERDKYKHSRGNR